MRGGHHRHRRTGVPLCICMGSRLCLLTPELVPSCLQEGFLRGHGTQVVDGRLVATLCGVSNILACWLPASMLASSLVTEHRAHHATFG